MSLSRKVLAFVAIPSIVQIGLLVCVANLNHEAELELLRSTRARNISDAINTLSKDALDIVASFGGDPDAIKNLTVDDPMFGIFKSRMDNDYDHLESLVKDDPKLLGITRDSRKTSEETLKNLMAVKESQETAGLSERALQKVLWKKIRASIKDVLKQELIYVGQEQKKLSERSPEIQAALRQKSQQVLIATAVFDLLLAVGAALIFIRTITERLERMCDNTLRLASNAPLNPPLEGNDEIARLDAEFHRMASELERSREKERAILNNAGDLICALDENGRITSANPASKTLLGLESEALEGRYIVDLVIADDTNRMLDYLAELKETDSAANRELRLRHASGEARCTLWSGQWSPSEKAFFLVLHDVTERRRAEDLRRELMAMVSHDLRSPLMTVSNVLDFFERGLYATFEEKGKKFVRSAARNTRSMIFLINDLLDIDKMGSGMMTLDRKPVSVDKLFTSVIENNSVTAEERGIELRIGSTADCLVFIDEERIARVLQNLVSNALKFAETSTTIEIDAAITDGFVEISVKDEGRGIPPDLIETIFDRYSQVDSREDSRTGSGLGLTICKSIVELHGGRIWVTSVEDVGSRFAFTVPLAQPE
ncbi:MAG: PAS domain S-box protein [Cyanobacteria bacterium HKST-UBA02]|nr:PAS domain S-box protein [Cyanobacteria bacterium HKST-UBA02]